MSTAPLRILVMNYEYPPIGGGGGKVSRDVAEALAARGHDVEVLTAAQGALPREETSGGVRVRRVRAMRRHADRCSVPEMAAYVLAAALAGTTAVRRRGFDVIHAHFAVPTGAAAHAVCRATGVPYVLTAHLGDVPGGVPEQTAGLFRIVQPFTVPIWRGAAAVTAVSSFVADLAERAYGIRPELILNGAPIAARGAPRITPGTGPVRLVWAGRMQAQKNLPWAIRALGTASDASWRLDLVGDGPQRGEVERLVDALGLRERVTLHGWVAAARVDAVMAAAEVLFMPSLSEGLSMASVDGLAHGLALLCSRIGGFADVAKEGRNALLFAPDTAGELAGALRAMCADRARLLAMREASARLAGQFELSHAVDRYEAVLHAAAAHPRRRAAGVAR